MNTPIDGNRSRIRYKKSFSEYAISNKKSTFDETLTSFATLRQASLSETRYIEKRPTTSDLGRKPVEPIRYGVKGGRIYQDNVRISRIIKRENSTMVIFDPESIRYFFGFLARRGLDFFLLSWFICGNYWIFHRAANAFAIEMYYDNPLNRSDLIKVDVSKHPLLFDYKFKQNDSNKWQYADDTNLSFVYIDESTAHLNCNMLCYDTAYYQIIVTYCLFIAFAVSVLLYRVYLIFYKRKKIKVIKIKNISTRNFPNLYNHFHTGNIQHKRSPTF
jgi:hypothetical protein